MTADQYRAAVSLPPRQAVPAAEVVSPPRRETEPIPEKREFVPSPAPRRPMPEADLSAISVRTPKSAAESAVEVPNTVLPAYRIIGEAFNCYVLVEQGDTLLLIDKHAAHERILFEEFKAKLKQVEGAAQLLLTPIVLTMSGEECTALEDYREELAGIGFAFTLAGTRVEITQIPGGVSAAAAPDLLGLLAAQILTDRGDVKLTRDLLFERALYQASCKSAIKGGRVYDEGHIAWLVERLLSLPDITVCPHGRPVAIKLTHHALDRQFSRE